LEVVTELAYIMSEGADTVQELASKSTKQRLLTLYVITMLQLTLILFGCIQVIEGMDVVQLMEKVATGTNDKPRMPVMITDCGQVSDEVVDDDNSSDQQQQQSAQATAAAKVCVIRMKYTRSITHSNCACWSIAHAFKSMAYCNRYFPSNCPNNCSHSPFSTFAFCCWNRTCRQLLVAVAAVAVLSLLMNLNKMNNNTKFKKKQLKRSLQFLKLILQL
jgi:hypothetical protein